MILHNNWTNLIGHNHRVYFEKSYQSSVEYLITGVYCVTGADDDVSTVSTVDSVDWLQPSHWSLSVQL